LIISIHLSSPTTINREINGIEKDIWYIQYQASTFSPNQPNQILWTVI
jgi:hypothetical protein